jgi:hypothetical protein
MRKTAAQPVQTGGQHGLDFTAPDRSQKLFQIADGVNVFPTPRNGASGQALRPQSRHGLTVRIHPPRTAKAYATLSCRR